MILNKDKMIESVLKAILGSDPHAIHGHIELQSALANQALQGLVSGLVEGDESLATASELSLRLAINSAIETRLDDSAFYTLRDPCSDPETD